MSSIMQFFAVIATLAKFGAAGLVFPQTMQLSKLNTGEPLLAANIPAVNVAVLRVNVELRNVTVGVPPPPLPKTPPAPPLSNVGPVATSLFALPENVQFV